MSAGHDHHHGRSGMSRAEADKVLSDPRVKGMLARPFTLDRTFDIPFLAGYSKNGGTIFIDRHLPQQVRIGNRFYDPTRSLSTHEHVEKALIDALGWKYPDAHEVATREERKVVTSAGLPWKPYEDALKPYIKTDDIEKLTRCPPDLDMTPYLTPPIDQRLLFRMAQAGAPVPAGLGLGASASLSAASPQAAPAPQQIPAPGAPPVQG